MYFSTHDHDHDCSSDHDHDCSSDHNNDCGPDHDDDHWVDNLRIESAYLVRSRQFRIELTLNRQQFTPTPSNFSYFAPATAPNRRTTTRNMFWIITMIIT